jgi:hypothetical protein
MTFLVVAVDIQGVDIDLGSKLRGTARKFAPHITILPRLRSDALRSRTDRAWNEVCAAVERLRDEPLELSGPVRITDDLDWYECAAGCRGRPALLNLHRLATARLLDEAADGPDPAFVGAGYRPHLTTSWRSHGGTSALPRRLKVRAVSLTVYSYKAAPWTSLVRREQLAKAISVR